MNITELENLAKAVLNETATCARAEAQQNFRFVANPQTIIQLIELLREMGEALEFMGSMYHLPMKVSKALAKFKEMTK